jgi:hypothetical protein
MTPVPDHTFKPVGVDSTATPKKESHPEIDRDAPAGSENSLGAESVRDGRPTTKGDVVEAIDEVEPGTPSEPSRE